VGEKAKEADMRNRVCSYLAILAAGVALGYAARALLPPGQGDTARTRFLERRQGQSGNTNPLLACDGASQVLSDPEIGSFQQSVETFLKARAGEKTSVYFRELNDGAWFSVGDAEQYIPASLRKVPLMMALLKQAEKETGLLQRRVPFARGDDDSARQNFKPSRGLVPGASYSVQDLIYRMIVYSDNNAFTLLTKIVDPGELMRVYSNLRMLDPQNVNSDNFLSVQTYESFFRVLYNCSYLSREASDWALEVLSKSEFSTGLVAGVPAGVKVAHKFGEKSDDPGGAVQLHDCGIVYYPQHPYLLCVMSKGQNFDSLSSGIAGVSRLVYQGVDAQARKQ
jgi:beta-lactamase class A